MLSNEIDSTVCLANICLIHFPHSGLWPFYVDGPHQLLHANSRDAREQTTVNGISHHLNYCVNFYSIYIYILFINVAAGRKIQAGGPRVGDPWSKTKRLVIPMVCQLHFDIIWPITNHIFNGTHKHLLICALIYADVTLRARKHTHHKQTQKHY